LVVAQRKNYGVFYGIETLHICTFWFHHAFPPLCTWPKSRWNDSLKPDVSELY